MTQYFCRRSINQKSIEKVVDFLLRLSKLFWVLQVQIIAEFGNANAKLFNHVPMTMDNPIYFQILKRFEKCFFYNKC